jgi:hypothetical protein
MAELPQATGLFGIDRKIIVSLSPPEIINRNWNCAVVAGKLLALMPSKPR